MPQCPHYQSFLIILSLCICMRHMKRLVAIATTRKWTQCICSCTESTCRIMLVWWELVTLQKRNELKTPFILFSKTYYIILVLNGNEPKEANKIAERSYQLECAKNHSFSCIQFSVWEGHDNNYDTAKLHHSNAFMRSKEYHIANYHTFTLINDHLIINIIQSNWTKCTETIY